MNHRPHTSFHDTSKAALFFIAALGVLALIMLVMDVN